MQITSHYKHLINSLAQKGHEGPIPASVQVISKHVLVVLITSILMWAYTLLAYLSISHPIPATTGLICSTVHLLSPLLFYFTTSAPLVSTVMLISILIEHGIFSYYAGGFDSYTLILFGVLPILAGIVAGKKLALIWGFIASILCGIYFHLELSGFPFPDLISSEGKLYARFLIAFGLIFLSTTLTYVLLKAYEQNNKIVADQGHKIDNLFRVLFHDLAGPLSRLSIGLSIATKNSMQGSRDRGLDVVAKATHAMLMITKNARDIYAISKGRLKSELIPFSVSESIDYVTKLYTSELEKKNITVNYHTQKNEDIKVLVEPVSFKYQVLGNALSNAIKFSPSSTQIDIRAYSMDEDFYVIEIKDHGIGMPQSILESLFDINKKTSRSGTNGENGTGLGMHIMKSFVEMYQGEIQVESTPGSAPHSGTTLKLILKTFHVNS